MTKNDELYDAALDAITALFSDRSVSQSEARANLKSLQDEIDVLIDSLSAK